MLAATASGAVAEGSGGVEWALAPSECCTELMSSATALASTRGESVRAVAFSELT